MEAAGDRIVRLESLLSDFQVDESNALLMVADELAAIRTAPPRFLLIERNMGGAEPPFWFTAWDASDAAAHYHVNQEYAADWEVVALHDLDTGEVFDGEARVIWTKRP